MSGTLTDTYVAALRHGTADVPPDAARVGVVRRPTPWFYAAVDENVPALAPPADLLESVTSRREALAERGVDDAEAHNRAMDDVDFDERYVAHLDRSAEAGRALQGIRDRLDAGEDVVLVCYEDTDRKHCHRTLLRSRLEG